MKKNRKLICLIFIAAAILALIVLPPVIKEKQKEASYKKALQLMGNGDFETPQSILWDLADYYNPDNEYKDALDLFWLCHAVLDYREGDYSFTHHTLKDLNFQYISSDDQERIDALRSKAEERYWTYLRQELEEEKRIYNEAVAIGVPFVGMYESDIDKMFNGKYVIEKIEHTFYNHTYPDMHVYKYRLTSDSGPVVFIAKCYKGKVLFIEDHRGNPIIGGRNNSSSSGDSYNAKNYSNAEDFYYDHYDDFFDYEEAESYFNDHH